MSKESIIEFLKEYSSCDNRCTRFPYYWTIADEKEKYEPCEGGEYVYDYGYAEVRPVKDVIQEIWNDDLTGKDRLTKFLEDNEITFDDFYSSIGTYAEDEFVLEEVLEDYLGESPNRMEKGYETYYEGMFLTQKDAEEYLESCRNHHFGPNPRTYLQSFNEWGRSSRTETFIKELFEYFNVPEPPELYYKDKDN